MILEWLTKKNGEEFRIESYKNETIVVEWNGEYWNRVKEKDLLPFMKVKIRKWERAKMRINAHKLMNKL